MGIINIGLDVGNYDVKTQNTVIPSGYSKHAYMPYGANDCMKYKDNIYVSEETRLAFNPDKLKNEDMFILSLLGIAKQMLYIAKNQNTKNNNVNGVDGEIRKMSVINLGIGLPLGMYASNKDKTVEYYQERLNGITRFTFDKYEFAFNVNKIHCYPQNLAALSIYTPDNPDSIIKKGIKNYYAVDIGGWTVDIATIVNGKPVAAQCTSKPLGVLSMFEYIQNLVEQQTGTRLDIIDIETVIKTEPTILSEVYQNIINSGAKEWFQRIKNELIQYGLQFESRPIIFLGGGALLFKNAILESKEICSCEFLTSSKANAKAYARLLSVGR